MRFKIGPLMGLSTAALLVFTLPGSAGEEEQGSVGLKFDAHRKWSFVIPDEQWHVVGDELSLDGLAFATSVSGAPGATKLHIDADADGKSDDVLRGLGGEVALRAKKESGERFDYAIRFRSNGTTWTWAPGGSMVGKVGGRTIHVIDRNGNGRYDDFGQDALIVGNGEAASFLSRVINVDGALYDFEISANGAQARVEPFEGDSGIINGVEGFEVTGKLVSAVVQDGDRSFNLADDENGVRVPVGKYRLVSGLAVRSTESVQMRTGHMAPIEVKAGEEKILSWGGPVQAEFDYGVMGTAITVSADLRFYGRMGEEYHTFKPDAKSPKIFIRDANTGELLDSGRFGGC